MRMPKKKTWWFILYGVLITALFLYLLFPAAIVKSRLEAQLSSLDFSFKAQSLQPSLPMGIRLKNLSVSSVEEGAVLFEGEMLDLQANFLNFRQKRSAVRVNGKAYGGNFKGRVGFISWNKVYPPVEGTLSFQDIDLAKYSFIKSQLGKDIAGKARGSLIYNNAAEAVQQMAGSINLFLVQGSYPLVDSFLGVNRIEYDRGEIKAQLKNGILKIEKLEIFGPQLNISLKGEIILAGDFKNSQLNLNGMMEILSKNKVKTKITINGTLASPVSSYI